MKTNIENSITADYIVTEVLSDTYDDAGILREKCFRWLFRIWTSLNLSMIRTSRITVLPVAPGTKTVMLPVDYQDFMFLGFPDNCGNWLPIAMNRNLLPQIGIENNNICETCGQVDLCSLNMEVAEETIAMGGSTYTKTTSKIIHPDGSYVEEVEEPVLVYGDTSSSYSTGVEMQTTRRVICQLDKYCTDCVPATPGNLQTLTGCGCTDALCCCSQDMLPYAVLPSNVHYNLFEEQGFIQFSPGSCIDKVLLKYVSSGTCIKGIYYFPLATMETLIAGVYYKSIEKKKNVPQIEKDRARKTYTAERKELLRNFTKLSYQEWREMIDTIPRLPTLGSSPPDWYMPVSGNVPVSVKSSPQLSSTVPSQPATKDVGLRSVIYTIAQTSNTLTVKELGDFAFLIMGTASYDRNYISQAGTVLSWTSGAPLFQQGIQISIYYNP